MRVSPGQEPGAEVGVRRGRVGPGGGCRRSWCGHRGWGRCGRGRTHQGGPLGVVLGLVQDARSIGVVKCRHLAWRRQRGPLGIIFGSGQHSRPECIVQRRHPGLLLVPPHATPRIATDTAIAIGQVPDSSWFPLTDRQRRPDEKCLNARATTVSSSAPGGLTVCGTVRPLRRRAAAPHAQLHHLHHPAEMIDAMPAAGNVAL